MCHLILIFVQVPKFVHVLKSVHVLIWRMSAEGSLSIVDHKRLGDGVVPLLSIVSRAWRLSEGGLSIVDHKKLGDELVPLLSIVSDR